MVASRVLAPLLGIGALFAVHFIGFLDGRGLNIVPVSIAGAFGGTLLGILCGGLVFSSLTPAWMKKSGPALMLFVTAVAVFFWGLLYNGLGEAVFGACFWGGMSLAPLLGRLLSVSASPGLHVGTAFAIGDFFWIFLLFLPTPPSPHALVGIVMFLQSVAGIVAALCLREARRTLPEPDRGTAKVSIKVTLGYLIAIAILFFFFNSFLDILFYRLHVESFPIPAKVHLYLWSAYPLIGLWIDKHGAGQLFFLVCLAGCLLAPILLGITEGTVVYWIIYTLSLLARNGVLVYLILVFSRIRKEFLCPELIVCIPYMAMLLTYLVAKMIIGMFPGTLYFSFLCLFWAAAFSYVSSRIQFALTLASGRTKVGADQQDDQDELHEGLAYFAKKYGISLREQDVLQLIVEGKDTLGICNELHLSENTIKTHVRQLLRKTETRNRITLVALFFNEGKMQKEGDHGEV